MSVDQLEIVRQYSFAMGPNYTASPLTLSETECAESDNYYHDGHLRTLPGAARLIATPMAHAVLGALQYNLANGTSYFVAASSGGRLAYQNLTTWVNVTTGLSSNANTFYKWAVFNDTLIQTNGSDPVKKWGGGSGTFANLATNVPQGRFVTVHTDYVLIAGQTANPSQIAYSDSEDGTTWPVGNRLNVGLDDGQIITGFTRFGDATVIFKERSIYLLTGATAADFTLNPTLSEVGCISPNSIQVTDIGVFFMSEVGPALFNGFKTVLLNGRMRRLLDTLDWDSPLAISAEFYHYRKHLLLTYARVGQNGVPDRGLLIDFSQISDQRTPVAFWPITFGWTSATDATDSTGRRRVYFGHTNGYVTAYDSGTTFNGSTILGRLRTRSYFPKRLDTIVGVRTLDTWWGGTTARVTVKTSIDGATFVPHVNSPLVLNGNTTTARLVHSPLSGAGASGQVVGRGVQVEYTTLSATPVEHLGLEVGFEPRGRRPARP